MSISPTNVPTLDYSYPVAADGYSVYQEIGVGAFASVYKGVVKATGEPVAIKVLDLDAFNANWDDIRREIMIMSLLNHPNVVKIKCSFVDGHSLWIVMSLLEGGSFASIMKTHYPNGIKDEVALATILKEVLQGLMYFHKDGRIHRDVKAGNILVSATGQVQLADFGVAGTLMENGDRKKNRQTFTGTPCWMAPEVMEHTSGYDSKADIWSFGITALELAFGRAPYSRCPPMRVILLTLQEDPPTCDIYNDRTHEFSKHFKSLIKKCLQKNPEKRPTAKELLSSRFFKLAAPTNAYLEEKIVKPVLMKNMQMDMNQSNNNHHSNHHNNHNNHNGENIPPPTVEIDIKGMKKSRSSVGVGPWVFDEDEFEQVKRQSLSEKLNNQQHGGGGGGLLPLQEGRGTGLNCECVAPSSSHHSRKVSTSESSCSEDDDVDPSHPGEWENHNRMVHLPTDSQFETPTSGNATPLMSDAAVVNFDYGFDANKDIITNNILNSNSLSEKRSNHHSLKSSSSSSPSHTSISTSASTSTSTAASTSTSISTMAAIDEYPGLMGTPEVAALNLTDHYHRKVSGVGDINSLPKLNGNSNRNSPVVNSKHSHTSSSSLEDSMETFFKSASGPGNSNNHSNNNSASSTPIFGGSSPPKSILPGLTVNAPPSLSSPSLSPTVLSAQPPNSNLNPNVIRLPAQRPMIQAPLSAPHPVTHHPDNPFAAILHSLTPSHAHSNNHQNSFNTSSPLFSPTSPYSISSSVSPAVVSPTNGKLPTSTTITTTAATAIATAKATALPDDLLKPDDIPDVTDALSPNSNDSHQRVGRFQVSDLH